MSKKKAAKTTDTTQTISAFKAFDADMKCRGYQFAEGETYHQTGNIVACQNGFHSCENPLDVLTYYNLCDSRFARVTASGTIARYEGDSKVASATLTIDAEIKLPEFIKSAVNYLMALCKDVPDSSKLAASGNSSIAMSAGTDGKAKVGKNGAIALTRWVATEKRYRISVAYEGENGIKADTWYTLDDDGNFIEA